MYYYLPHIHGRIGSVEGTESIILLDVWQGCFTVMLTLTISRYVQ